MEIFGVGGVGRFQKPKPLNKSIKLNWNSPRELWGGGVGVGTHTQSEQRVFFFLTLNNSKGNSASRERYERHED